MEDLIAFFQGSLVVDFGFDDDRVIDSLVEASEELRRMKLDLPPPPADDTIEKPQLPFGHFVVPDVDQILNSMTLRPNQPKELSLQKNRPSIPPDGGPVLVPSPMRKRMTILMADQYSTLEENEDAMTEGYSSRASITDNRSDVESVSTSGPGEPMSSITGLSTESYMMTSASSMNMSTNSHRPNNISVVSNMSSSKNGIVHSGRNGLESQWSDVFDDSNGSQYEQDLENTLESFGLEACQTTKLFGGSPQTPGSILTILDGTPRGHGCGEAEVSAAHLEIPKKDPKEVPNQRTVLLDGTPEFGNRDDRNDFRDTVTEATFVNNDLEILAKELLAFGEVSASFRSEKSEISTLPEISKSKILNDTNRRVDVEESSASSDAVLEVVDMPTVVENRQSEQQEHGVDEEGKSGVKTRSIRRSDNFEETTPVNKERSDDRNSEFDFDDSLMNETLVFSINKAYAGVDTNDQINGIKSDVENVIKDKSSSQVVNEDRESDANNRTKDVTSDDSKDFKNKLPCAQVKTIHKTSHVELDDAFCNVNCRETTVVANNDATRGTGVEKNEATRKEMEDSMERNSDREKRMARDNRSEDMTNWKEISFENETKNKQRVDTKAVYADKTEQNFIVNCAEEKQDEVKELIPNYTENKLRSTKSQADENDSVQDGEAHRNTVSSNDLSSVGAGQNDSNKIAPRKGMMQSHSFTSEGSLKSIATTAAVTSNSRIPMMKSASKGSIATNKGLSSQLSQKEASSGSFLPISSNNVSVTRSTSKMTGSKNLNSAGKIPPPTPTKNKANYFRSTSKPSSISPTTPEVKVVKGDSAVKSSGNGEAVFRPSSNTSSNTASSSSEEVIVSPVRMPDGVSKSFGQGESFKLPGRSGVNHRPPPPPTRSNKTSLSSIPMLHRKAAHVVAADNDPSSSDAKVVDVKSNAHVDNSRFDNVQLTRPRAIPILSKGPSSVR